MILEKFPKPKEFYSKYWNKKPFVVRGAVAKSVFDELIDAESLAALSMEEEVRSRIVVTQKSEKRWLCEHGPFKEEYFSTLGDDNWSLLVQNVEQYHTDTAKLLNLFHFSPRWLMDDIMVSYSVNGGSVGPHTDSYHVFLVQGMGRRSWTVGYEPIVQEELIEESDLKVLKDGFDGQTVEVTMGDVVYIPPHFAHEGKTIEEALTFSVGFLGPKRSEMLIEYGHYLEQREQNDLQYSGAGLNEESGAFIISPNAQKSLQSNLVDAINADDFSKWLASYFSVPTYEDPENIQVREDQLTGGEILGRLQDGESLYKPEYIKLVVIENKDMSINLSVYGAVITVTSSEHKSFIFSLNDNQPISSIDEEISEDLMAIITHLYNQNVLFFQGEDLTLS